MKPSPLVATAGALVIISIVISIALYDRVPDPMPTHFDLRGHADGFTSKPLGPFIGPIMIAALAAIFIAFPKISPRGYQIERFRGTYEIVASAVIGLVFFVSMTALSIALGAQVRVDRLMLIGIGVLFVILGNFMGKIRRNFFVGIRTPWTLASEEVWLRTHRLGGRLFVIAGLVLMAGAFFDATPALILAVILTTAAWLTVYSYVIYRRVEGRRTDDDDVSAT
jgi:uncharacterized membrane protein